MAKNIVICCDGTGNDFDNSQFDSNVVKLYRCLEINASQVAYYHPGVGTMGDPTLRFWADRQWSKIKGLAFGAGLKANIADSYRYLMNTYEDGDRIYLIGFSRGAYTARALAGLINMCGLLCAGNEGLIPYIMRMFSKWSRKAKYAQQTAAPNEAFKWGFSHTQNIEIHFCGVWDTVSSYGWIYKPIKLPFEGQNAVIRIGRHAVSMHERRCFYTDRLWGAPLPGQDIRQVWFAGVHSDVGGSYLEAESGLSKISLEWMMVEAQRHGLLFNCTKAEIILGKRVAPGFLPTYQPPDPNGILHPSLKGPWWIPEFMLQRNPHRNAGFYIPCGRSRTIPPNSLIHETSLNGPHLPPTPLVRPVSEQWVRFSCPPH